MSHEIVIRQPDDWHVHLRDGEELKSLVPWTARHFARAVVMPNLKTPITSLDLAKSYRQRIEAATPQDLKFTPLMTFYLTDQMNPQDLQSAIESGLITAAKLYPAHATTNSASGVTDIRKVEGCLDVLERLGRPLLVHAESAESGVDVFDRELVFLEKILTPLMDRHQDLKVVVEHVTTREGLNFVRRYAPRCAATITAHHLVLNRNDMFAGGLRPHAYCLPVAKREEHRQALVQAVTSGESCFFLGTDSAPHSIEAKESDCGCAGIFSAPTAMAIYARIFAGENRLDRLENFSSVFGPQFYGLPPNEKRMLLKETPHTEPELLKLNPQSKVRVFEGGKDLNWTLKPVS